MPTRNYSIVSQASVQILTVNPAKRIIEGSLPDKSKIALPVWNVPSAFRWPQVGEIWSIHREAGKPWCLGSRVTDVSTLATDSLLLDSARVIDSQGRKVLVEGDVDPGVLDPSLMHWRGDWSSTTAYSPNDVVYASSSPWLALVSNVNSLPSTSNTNWRQLASPPAVGLQKKVFPLGSIVGGTPISLSHNLGTKDVCISIYTIATGEVIFADVTFLDGNTVQVTFASSYSANTYQVVIIG